MSLGRRQAEVQGRMFIAVSELAVAAGHGAFLGVALHHADQGDPQTVVLALKAAFYAMNIANGLTMLKDVRKRWGQV
jgi:hypothetical protein